MNPVWLNRDVPLYTVRVRRPDGAEHVFLVLTEAGPIAAKAMAEQGGTALYAKQVGFPLICDDEAEIERITQDTSLLSKRHQLRLFRVVLAHDTGDKTLLVWTTKGVKFARRLAEQSIPGGEWRNTFAVTNPVIVGDSIDKVLERA